MTSDTFVVVDFNIYSIMQFSMEHMRFRVLDYII